MSRVGTKKRPITVPIPYYPGRLGTTNSAHTTHPSLREISRNEDHVLLSCPWCGKTEVIEH